MRLALLVVAMVALGCGGEDRGPVASPPAGEEQAPQAGDPRAAGPVASAPPAPIATLDALAPQADGPPAGGGPTVSGGEVANAQAVVAGWAAGFRRCFQQALAQRPDVSGRVTLVVKVGPSGEVQAVTATGVVGLPDELVSCAKARAMGAVFMPPVGGHATISVPLTFKSP